MTMTYEEYRIGMALGLLLVVLLQVLTVIMMSFFYDRKVRRLCSQCRSIMRAEQDSYCRECWSMLRDKYSVQASSNDRMNNAFRRRAIAEPTRPVDCTKETFQTPGPLSEQTPI